jgi:hypothetical protein
LLLATGGRQQLTLIPSFLDPAVLSSVISFVIYAAVNDGINAADIFASLSLFQVSVWYFRIDFGLPMLKDTHPLSL